MPKILEIKEIDGTAWVRLGVPGEEFASGVSLWTIEEQQANERQQRLICADMLEDEAGQAIDDHNDRKLSHKLSEIAEKFRQL